MEMNRIEQLLDVLNNDNYIGLLKFLHDDVMKKLTSNVRGKQLLLELAARETDTSDIEYYFDQNTELDKENKKLMQIIELIESIKVMNNKDVLVKDEKE